LISVRNHASENLLFELHFSSFDFLKRAAWIIFQSTHRPSTPIFISSHALRQWKLLRHEHSRDSHEEEVQTLILTPHATEEVTGMTVPNNRPQHHQTQEDT